MRKNAHKYLAFPSVNIFESLYSSRQRLYLSNSIFSKHSYIHTYIHTHIHTYVHAYIYTYVYYSLPKKGFLGIKKITYIKLYKSK